MRRIAKKMGFILIGLIISIIILRSGYSYFTYGINSKMLDSIEGQIHYSKRIDGDSVILTSDANLQNEFIVYQHDGEVNNNIIQFYYDKSDESYYFIAMDNGEWSKFNYINGDVSKVSSDYNMRTQYISTNSSIYEKQGSIYKDGKVIKTFYGIYDHKFTGYRVKGLSPDGKYLIYSSNGHLTSLGYILGSFIPYNSWNVYIMDLETFKSTNYVNSGIIQCEQ